MSVNRTLKAVEERYNAARQEKLDAIANNKISPSLSGIEYYPKPWDELDMNDSHDILVISTALTWNSEIHDCEGLRRYSEKELELLKERDALMYKNHDERKERIHEIDVELNTFKLKKPYPLT